MTIKVSGALAQAPAATPAPSLPPVDLVMDAGGPTFGEVIVLSGAPLQNSETVLLSAPTSGTAELVVNGAANDADPMASAFPFVGNPIQGAQGPAGPAGPQGEKGRDGQIRFTGNGAPNGILGAQYGDTYLDLDSGVIYKLM